MRGWRAVAIAGWVGALGLSASLPLLMGDAARGQALFRAQGCLGCHSLNGEGGSSAPDLGVHGGRGFSPAAMAALMWNHGPRMWAAIEKRGAIRPQLTEQQAADLFAYFYAARYFEPPGNARRGSAIFSEKGCASCHKGPQPGPGGARPVSAWEALENPIALAQHLWNHSAQMRQAMAQMRIPYPELTAEDLADLTAYVRRLRKTPGPLPQPEAGSAQTGEQIFTAKRCAACHTGHFDLRTRRTRFGLADFAASLWNHAPGMPGLRSTLDYDEMRHTLAYLGSLQYFEEHGNIDRGLEVFRKKRCSTCHNDPSSGAPDLSGRVGSFSSYGMVAALWKHGPTMVEAMKRKKLAWPEFSPAEMADLVAYLHGPRLKRR